MVKALPENGRSGATNPRSEETIPAPAAAAENTRNAAENRRLIGKFYSVPGRASLQNPGRVFIFVEKALGILILRCALTGDRVYDGYATGFPVPGEKKYHSGSVCRG